MELPLLVVIAQIVSFYFIVKDKNCLIEHVIAESGDMSGEGFFINSKDNKTGMPKDEFFGCGFMPLFCFGYEASLFSKTNDRISRQP